MFEGVTQKQPFPFASRSGECVYRRKKIPQLNMCMEDEIWEILRKEEQPNKSLKCHKLATGKGFYLYAKMFKSICQST